MSLSRREFLIASGASAMALAVPAIARADGGDVVGGDDGTYVFQRVPINELVPTGSLTFGVGRSASKTVVFDPGYNGDLTRMKLLDRGINPNDVTDVIFTHATLGNTGGALYGGQLLFPNATHIMSADEYNFWMNNIPDRRLVDPENMQRAGNVQRNLVKIQPKLRLIDIDDTIEPGLLATQFVGVSPGSFGVLVAIANGSIMWCGALFDDNAIARISRMSPDLYTSAGRTLLSRVKCRNTCGGINAPYYGSRLSAFA